VNVNVNKLNHELLLSFRKPILNTLQPGAVTLIIIQFLQLRITFQSLPV